jgi:hypothetical protein
MEECVIGAEGLLLLLLFPTQLLNQLFIHWDIGSVGLLVR